MSKQKILVVEDEPEIRAMLRAALDINFEVIEAEDGAQGIDLFILQSPDLVLSDIRMPNMDGIELLKKIKARSSTPVILMTAYSDLLQTQSAFDLGADEFLSKPFHIDDVEKAVNSTLSQGRAELSVGISDKFCKVHVAEFETLHSIAFDLYFKVSDGKYFKIFKKGQTLEMDRMRSYIARGLTHLHILKVDFAAFVGFSLEQVNQSLKTPSAHAETKQKKIKSATEAVMQSIYQMGLDQKGFSDAKDLVERSVEIVGTHNELSFLLEALNDHSDQLYAHAVGVSIYSSVIAKSVGWKSPAILSKVSLCGLFHDIGLKELDPELTKKDRMRMSSQEIKLYETHCQRGGDILSGVKGIPTDLAIVASQHHESNTGLGYPGMLKKGQIHPIAKIVHVADLFCELTIKDQYDLPESSESALKKIYQLSLPEIEPACLAALYKAFKVEMPPDLEKSFASSSFTF